MTKAELIEELAHLSDDTEIYLREPSHDYWSNQLAVSLESVREELVEKSDYHNGKLRILDENREREEDIKEVYVLG